MADISIFDQGTLVGFRPNSQDAYCRMDESVMSEDYQWLGRTLWVDHRYADGLIEHLESLGLEVDW